MSREFTVRLMNKILFPVDLSDVAGKTAPVVSEVAVKFDAQVHFIFVIPLLGHCMSSYLLHPYIRDFDSEIEEGAMMKLREFMAARFDGAFCDLRIVLGDPAEEILKYAQSEGIDLIIIGTHGKKGIEHGIFGSVAERVKNESRIPVLTIDPYKEWDDEHSVLESLAMEDMAIAS